MTNLSDTQRILIATAAQRDDHSLLPLPASIKSSGGVTKAITALVKHGFAEECAIDGHEATARTDGDLRYGVFATAAGLAEIGIESAAEKPVDGGTAYTDPAPAKRSTKTEAVVALLTRPDGATLPELIETTGWLPHTTRAALTGLRKKGHEIVRGKRDGATCYRIVEAA